MSFSMLYGPIDLPSAETIQEPRGFPHNVVFKQANYVLKDEALLGCESAAYDLVLCLSTTKWLHLNWGDAGLKMAFRRMFADLRPGGKLVLESQNWASYKKKKRLTPTIYENFNSIEFFPNKFREYLLSPEVGFSKCCILGVPQHASKGFRRPIQLYIKGDFTPSKAQWSDAYLPPSSHHRQDGAEPPRRTVYAALPPVSTHATPLGESPATHFATPDGGASSVHQRPDSAEPLNRTVYAAAPVAPHYAISPATHYYAANTPSRTTPEGSTSAHSRPDATGSPRRTVYALAPAAAPDVTSPAPHCYPSPDSTTAPGVYAVAPAASPAALCCVSADSSSTPVRLPSAESPRRRSVYVVPPAASPSASSAAAVDAPRAVPDDEGLPPSAAFPARSVH